LLDVPDTPGNRSLAEFGLAIGWGRGSAVARARMATISFRELEETGMTIDLAVAWRDFYDHVDRKFPDNPSAAGRRELMQRVIELLARGSP